MQTQGWKISEGQSSLKLRSLGRGAGFTSPVIMIKLSQGFDGKIDDARIYNYALSPQQIREVYNAGFGTYFK